MKNLSRLTLCTALLLLIFPNALPQKRRSCPTPPPSPFKHSGEIVTSFDSAARAMRTTLEHPRPLGDAQNALYLSASFVHRDTRSGARQSLELLFASSSMEYRFRQGHDLVLVCDGRPAPLTSPARYRSRTDGGMILEATSVTLSPEDLSVLTGARKVKARLGAQEFELTNNHLEALRAMASLMGASPSRWRAE